MSILSTRHHVTLTAFFCVILSGCMTNSPTAQAEQRAQTIKGDTLRFVAGEFRAEWTSAPEEDVQSQIEDRFPFVTDNDLLFLEIGQDTQRASVINYDKLINMQWGFLSQDVIYPPEQQAPKNWWDESPEPPAIIAMYQGGAVLEADIEGQRLKSLKSLSRTSISANDEVQIRDYLKIKGKEWIVSSDKVEMRHDGDTKPITIFQCKTGVFSVNVQNDTVAVGYKDSKLMSSVCVFKTDSHPRNNCECRNAIKNATNPFLSKDGKYLAVASSSPDNEHWDLKVGSVDNFSSQSLIEVDNINFYDIINKTVLYQNSYAWGGNTLIFSKGKRGLYKVTCKNGTCDDYQSIEIPKNISVCGADALVWRHQQNANQEDVDTTDYIEDTLKWKDNQPLWFQAATRNCLDDVKKYKIASVKWGQPFFIKGQPYLATESRLKFIGSGSKGKWIARILVFAIE